jgi:hypothetical protein
MYVGTGTRYFHALLFFDIGTLLCTYILYIKSSLPLYVVLQLQLFVFVCVTYLFSGIITSNNLIFNLNIFQHLYIILTLLKSMIDFYLLYFHLRLHCTSFDARNSVFVDARQTLRLLPGVKQKNGLIVRRGKA